MLDRAAVKFLFAGGALIAAAFGVKHLSKKKVFISFAVEDRDIRDLMAGQSRNNKTPFEFVDRSVKIPYENAWKTQCRERIMACHGVIVLVSENIYKAEGLHWEIKCAKEEGIPVRAIYARKNSHGCKIPDVLKGHHVYKWTWDNINNFVNELK